MKGLKQENSSTSEIESQEQLIIPVLNLGEVSSYSHTSDSESTMIKKFCSNCGSLPFGKNSAKINVLSIRAGTVDQLDLIKPAVNVFMDSKVPSTSIDKNLKQASRIPS